jgi:DMSO/TMAO reductase YedYZ molybdopterin-dependent catalytic subunit
MSDVETAGREELQLATRNHGMPLEALRYDVTPPGLHYLLIHYDIPEVDTASYRLSLGGSMERELTLSIDDVLRRPQVSMPVTFECAGNGRALLDPRPVSQPWILEAVGTGEWTGTPLRGLLEEAGVRTGATEVLFTGLDRGIEGEVEQTYERAVPLSEAMREEVLLVHSMDGRPLLPQHGAPLRIVIPGWYGMTNVKWLSAITVLDDPYEGYQNARSYRLRADPDEQGEPLSRMRPRALLIPPGIPEFMSRTRIVGAGAVRLKGRAWSGLGEIVGVEVSSDGGTTWEDAVLEPAVSAWAWRGWTFDWNADPGEHVLCCRATDSTGETQPLEPQWNVGGYANNAVQRVPVIVRD